MEPALEGSGESELWRRFRGFRRFGRPRFGRVFGRRRWGRPWGRAWGGAFLPAPAFPVAPAPAPAADDAPSADSGDTADASEEFALEAGMLPENENESEFWRRYRSLRRGGFRRRGSRRRRFLRWRRRQMMGSSGSGMSQSDEPDTGDSGGDDSDGSELTAMGEVPGETESEVRGYRYGRGYRYPAYRARTVVRPYRYGVGRTYLGRRYPFYRGGAFVRGRSPWFGRTWAGRAWPVRRFYGGRFYAPLASRRWPWFGRRFYGYRPPVFAPGVPVPALPPPPVSAPIVGGPGPAGSPWILLVQGCLRKLLGPDATPVNGVLGRRTQSALRAFQQQNGLPPTGGLDNATVQALQGACMGSGAAPPPPPAGAEPPAGPPPPDAGAPPPSEPPPPPPDGGGPPPDAGGAPPPPEGAAPPEGAPAGDAPPPGDAPQGEITLGRREGESEQEFLVDGAARIDVERHDPVPLDRDPQFSWAPDAPGLYVIYVGGKPWYVGIAETSIRHRFLQRRKVLNDLQIPPSATAGRSVGWYLLRYSTVPRGAIQRREQGNPRAAFRPVYGKYSILRILEQVYIKRLKNPSGNQQVEAVQFSPKGSLVVTENGVKVSEYQPNSRV